MIVCKIFLADSFIKRNKVKSKINEAHRHQYQKQNLSFLFLFAWVFFFIIWGGKGARCPCFSNQLGGQFVRRSYFFTHALQNIGATRATPTAPLPTPMVHHTDIWNNYIIGTLYRLYQYHQTYPEAERCLANKTNRIEFFNLPNRIWCLSSYGFS